MMSKTRLEMFSDGVLAIVITLLVIEIRPPEVGEHESLASALWDLWPSYVGYALSFLIVGVLWLNHHRIFEPVRVVDGPLLLLNLNLLLWAVLIPFPTSVLAEYLPDGGAHARTAMALYAGVILVTAASFVALYSWITHGERLVHVLPVRSVVRKARIRFAVGLGVYAAAFALSWLSPPAALIVHAGMALYYLFDQTALAGHDTTTIQPRVIV